MNWFSKINPVDMAEKNRRIEELERELVSAGNTVSALRAKLSAYEDALSAATPMIDFDVMRVFSIERNKSQDRPCTILGYYMNEPVISSDGEMVVDQDVVKEWALYCNNERHEELVNKFLEWKKNGKQ